MNAILKQTNLKVAAILLRAVYRTIMRLFTYGTSAVGILVIMSLWDNATTKSFAQYTPEQVHALWQGLNSSFAITFILGLVVFTELLNVVFGYIHPIQHAFFELLDMGVLKSQRIDAILLRSQNAANKFPCLKTDMRNALMGAAFSAIVFTWLLSGNTLQHSAILLLVMFALNIALFRLARKFFPDFVSKYFGN